MRATNGNQLWVEVEAGRRSNEESPKPSRWEKRLFWGDVREANLAQAKGVLRRAGVLREAREVSGDNIHTPELVSRLCSPQD